MPVRYKGESEERITFANKKATREDSDEPSRVVESSP